MLALPREDGQQDQVEGRAATGARQVEGPYRRVPSNAWLGHNALQLCADTGMTTLNHRNVTLGQSADRRHKPWQTEMLMTIRTTLNHGGVRITVD